MPWGVYGRRPKPARSGQGGAHAKGDPMAQAKRQHILKGSLPGFSDAEIKRMRGIWLAMRYRCYSPKNKAYKYYGARGIRVCARWHTFRNFLTDMGVRPPGGTLERISNKVGYRPSNCRWVTQRQQMRNISTNRWYTAFGKTLILADWARETGLHPATLRHRLFVLKLSVDAAFSTPLSQGIKLT